MENTKDNKVIFLAQYWGQKIVDGGHSFGKSVDYFYVNQASIAREQNRIIEKMEFAATKDELNNFTLKIPAEI